MDGTAMQSNIFLHGFSHCKPQNSLHLIDTEINTLDTLQDILNDLLHFILKKYYLHTTYIDSAFALKFRFSEKAKEI